MSGFLRSSTRASKISSKAIMSVLQCLVKSPMDARSYERASVGLFARAGWRGVPRQTRAVVTAFFGLALSCAPSPGTSCRGSCGFCPPVPLIAVRCSPSGRGGRLRQVMLAFGKSILALTRVNCKQGLPMENPLNAIQSCAGLYGRKKSPCGWQGLRTRAPFTSARFG